MIRRSLLVFLLGVVVSSCGSQMADSDVGANTRSVPRTLYSGNETGPKAVGAIPDVTLHDNDRNKDLVVTIEYPTEGTAYPLILFSPGTRGTNRSYTGLSSYWASNGYVVIRVGHRMAASQSVEDARDRMRDLGFVLDSLKSLEQRYPELQGKVDPARVGVGGHSYGAYTAMLTAGLETFPGNAGAADARVKAVVAMSPQGPASPIGLTDESWQDVRTPVLFLSGSEDRGMTETETPEWRKQAFVLSPAGDKWLVMIEGARHNTFLGQSDELLEALARERSQVDPLDPNTTVNPSNRRMPRGSRAEAAAMRQQDMFAIARGVSLAFWDAYLKNDPKGREALEKASSRKGVTVEKK